MSGPNIYFVMLATRGRRPRESADTVWASRELLNYAQWQACPPDARGCVIKLDWSTFNWLPEKSNCVKETCTCWTNFMYCWWNQSIILLVIHFWIQLTVSICCYFPETLRSSMCSQNCVRSIVREKKIVSILGKHCGNWRLKFASKRNVFFLQWKR